MAEFYDAPEVEKVAKELISKYHTHLVEANIRYLFRSGAWTSKDRTTWGQAIKVSERDKHITGLDFIIIINFEIWNILESGQRKALVDHELCHCGRRAEDALDGSPRWYIVGHDLEDFVAVVSRHGYWADSVKRMAEAMKVHRGPSLLDHGLEDPGREVEGETLKVVSGSRG